MRTFVGAARTQFAGRRDGGTKGSTRRRELMGESTVHRIRGGVGLAMLVVVCFGCASARVKNVEEARPRPLPKPSRVIVFNFETGAADVRVGTSPRRAVRNAVGLYVQEPD